MRNTRFSAVMAIAVMAGALGVAGSAWGQEAGGAAAEKKAATFAEVVRERFAAWDADDDGTLTAAEVDKACVNPSIKGAEAAAVAALKRVVRSDKYALPALTKEYLTKAAARSARPRTEGNADREDSTEREGAGSRGKTDGDGAAAKPDGQGPNSPTPKDGAPRPRPTPATDAEGKFTGRPDFERSFKTCMDRIQNSDRALFASEADPTIAHCHQGPLGDCFFVSVVGAVVKRDPAALKQMVQVRPEDDGGGYLVKFGGGREVRIASLTDAELAISSTTSDKAGDEGVWLAVLEKAFGTSRLEDMPDRYDMESATDAIAKGGTTSTSIRLLTGHTTERIVLKRREAWAMQQFDVNRRLLPPPAGTKLKMKPADDLATLETKVREKVSSALAANRIVATGTGEEKQPPGISGKHAYAVLAYDAARDVVTLWNPHGNTFVVRGGKEPGVESGYPTKAGIFEMPVKDFVRVFNSVTMETGKEAGRGRRG